MADILMCTTFEGTLEKFSFGFRDDNKLHRLSVSIPIPLKISAKEFACRLIKHHQIPCYLEEELTKALEKFLWKSLTSLYDKMGDLAINHLVESPQSCNDYINSWANAFKREHSKYSQTSDANEDVRFAEIYHSLIHSAALETLLQLDNTYALALQDLLSHRDSALKSCQEKHQSELDDAISAMTDRDVSNIAARQMENSQMLETYWSSELSQLQEMQKREYREWVIKVHEDTMNPAGDTSLATGQFKTRTVSTLSVSTPEEFQSEPETQMEESFTIHLGAQQKTMHNLRLICGDVLDICRHKATPGSVFSHPHRIQTAFSLYSESLTGIILLVDNRLDIYSGISKEFATICQQSTEFHFPDLDKQICLIQQNIELKSRSISTASTGEVSSGNASSKVPTLKPGDFYITRHSNLANAQVVFHLVVDDTVKSLSLNSRNMCIIGLRHILHTAVRYNITTLTIPLLLFHDMKEEMTINWCVKRSELVLKCVKGFMMECASWSGLESLNIQFMLPKRISPDMFNTISNMLPNIFRISTPLDLTSSSNR